jgi:hypothetical protein
MKLEIFYTAKEMVTRLKRQLQLGKKIFDSYILDRVLITRIYRELKKLTSQRINNPLNKWANELDRQFSKEEIQMANKNMKKCSSKHLWP